MPSVKGVSSVNAATGIGTFAFSDGATTLTTYTYTDGGGTVAGTVLAAPYDMSLSDYINATVMIREWLRHYADTVEKPTYPPLPTYTHEVKIDRATGKADMTLRISGTKYADVQWTIVSGLDGMVHIKARPAFTFDRTTFDLFIAAHHDFGDLCFRLNDGQ